MDRTPWSARTLAALLTLLVLVGFCDVGAVCASIQETSGKCCCPVEGPSPCLDQADDPGDAMPEPEATPSSLKIPSVAPPSAELCPELALDAATSPCLDPSTSRLASPVPVFLMCCVFLH